jgi:hypothetical protein
METVRYWTDDFVQTRLLPRLREDNRCTVAIAFGTEGLRVSNVGAPIFEVHIFVCWSVRLCVFTANIQLFRTFGRELR